MKKVFIVFAVLSSLFLTSCAQPSAEGDDNSNSLVPFLDFNNKTDLKDAGDITLWPESESDIVSEISACLGNQTNYQDQYELSSEATDSTYLVIRNERETSCSLFMRVDDNGCPTTVRAFCDTMGRNNLEAFVALSSSLLQVSLSNINSFSDGYAAFNGLYYGEKEIGLPSTTDGFSGVIRFEPSDSSFSLTISKVSNENLAAMNPTTTYNEPNTSPLPDQNNVAKSDDVIFNTARHDRDMICICAQDIVKESIPTPSTAKFCKWSEMVTQDLGNGHYQCSGWVDAENLYGATVRYDFLVYYTATDDGYKEGGAELFPHGQ